MFNPSRLWLKYRIAYFDRTLIVEDTAFTTIDHLISYLVDLTEPSEENLRKWDKALPSLGSYCLVGCYNSVHGRYNVLVWRWK